MSALLDIRGAGKRYGQLQVLKSVTFSVDAQETFGIIGPNGAGKTTLFKVMTGEVEASDGSVWFAGEDVTRLPAYVRTRKGMGRTFQVARVFLEQTVLANVIVAVEARRRTEGQSVGKWYAWRASSEVNDEAGALLRELGLTASAGVEARFLSHGDKKRLELALALALKPKVLMLDEPTAGMSSSNRMSIVDLIDRIRNEHKISVVMTEHDMDVIFNLAHRLMVLNYGEVVAIGPVEEVRQNPVVREVYLGKEMYVA